MPEGYDQLSNSELHRAVAYIQMINFSLDGHCDIELGRFQRGGYRYRPAQAYLEGLEMSIDSRNGSLDVLDIFVAF
jgi:hypothetical protein